MKRKVWALISTLKIVNLLISIYYGLNVLDLIFTFVAVKLHGLQHEGNFYMRALMEVSMPLAFVVKLGLPLMVCVVAYLTARQHHVTKIAMIASFIVFNVTYALVVWNNIQFLI